MHPDEILQKMADLQRTDSGLDELERLRAGFLKESAALDAGSAAAKERLQEAKKSLEETLKLRKTLEIEAGTLETRIKKYVGQEAEVKSNEQFTALKHEIEKTREEKAAVEEKELDLLYREDERKKRILELASLLEEDVKRVAAEKIELRRKGSDCEKAAEEKKAERTVKLAALPEDWAASYETLRNNGKKIAVAEVKADHTCGGCNMSVPPQILNEVKKGIAIQRCNCGRFLYAKD